VDKAIERAGHREVLRRVGTLLAPLGLQRRKTTFFVRCRAWVAEFVHLHKYRSAPAYRVHLGIRVLNDTFSALALNGPHSVNGSPYALANGRDEASTQRCAEEVYRWCLEVGEPWFQQFRDLSALLTEAASPLRDEEKARLRLALTGAADLGCVEASRRLLGLVRQ
jgi:hypothetical protein